MLLSALPFLIAAAGEGRDVAEFHFSEQQMAVVHCLEQAVADEHGFQDVQFGESGDHGFRYPAISARYSQGGEVKLVTVLQLASLESGEVAFSPMFGADDMKATPPPKILEERCRGATWVMIIN